MMAACLTESSGEGERSGLEVATFVLRFPQTAKEMLLLGRMPRSKDSFVRILDNVLR